MRIIYNFEKTLLCWNRIPLCSESSPVPRYKWMKVSPEGRTHCSPPSSGLHHAWQLCSNKGLALCSLEGGGCRVAINWTWVKKIPTHEQHHPRRGNTTGLDFPRKFGTVHVFIAWFVHGRKSLSVCIGVSSQEKRRPNLSFLRTGDLF